ncbi:hypothetical protein N9C31_02225 [Gammaproteobacteria bacterium]|nr:hypothetical protein [Gammaproteobacteria bacterium]
MNKQNKKEFLVASPKNVLQKQDEDSGEGGFTGPKNDTYARILSDLGGNLDPEMLEGFNASQEKQAKTSAHVSSQDFKKHQKQDQNQDQRSEKENQPTPEQAFSKSRSGPRR